ncbi:hypothetical protein [Polaribacter cellanae]|uniref:Lipocalin-like domain-containing protein n=1 Tax=Polaribacter cellanae TaxID=2818493 RepID=A0A975CP93_9FLAO|nr:hypothetical protein [Polaribacter cellanae]QTE22190.1 hypothetical protein J3359_15470 [Polaribacter cellanae]
MKNMYLILSIFLFTTGCSEKDTKQQENSIYNKWSLIKFEPGFSPTKSFSENQIIWTFNSNSSLNVLISNGTEVSDRLPLNSNGEYIYTTNNNELVINNNQSFKYEITNNKLILSTFIGLEAGGMRITFKKRTEE